MKHRGILVAQMIVLSLAVILLVGCDSGQQDSAALQKALDEREDALERVLRDQEVIVEEFLNLTRELQECREQLAWAQKENEILKKARQLTPTELQKGLAELKAAREAAAKRLREQAAAEANEP